MTCHFRNLSGVVALVTGVRVGVLDAEGGKDTAEVHDYHDEQVGVLASSLAKRAPGYTSLGFPDPRKLPYSPSAAATPSVVLASPI